MLRYIIVLSFLTFGVHAFGQSDQTAQTKKIAQDTFKVEGVCKMCKERIENAALVKGVKFAEWDQNTSNLVVAYKTSKVSLEDIHKAIAEAGHDTDLIKAEPAAYQKLPACCAYNDGVEKH
jgi:copper chaperone CopZ